MDKIAASVGASLIQFLTTMNAANLIPNATPANIGYAILLTAALVLVIALGKTLRQRRKAEREVALRPQATSPQPQQAGPAVGHIEQRESADELAKLAKLRSDGSLTDDEFKKLKAKLIKSYG